MSKATYRRFDPWRAAPVTEESRETILSGHYFDIDRTSFDSRDIGHFDRLIVHKNNGDSVGVIGLTDDGLIPLIEQYRIPVHRWTLEIPAGHAIKQGERPLDVAKRKFAEEVGYEAEHLTPVLPLHQQPELFHAVHRAVLRFGAQGSAWRQRR